MSRPAHPAAYVRVIGARGANDPHVRQQRQAVLRAASRRGWPYPAVYIDIGLPGWHRPGSALAELAERVAAGSHDAVIALNLTRISRDQAEVTAFAAHCGRCGVTLETVDEGRIDGPPGPREPEVPHPIRGLSKVKRQCLGRTH